jgi:hypothetical protein
MDEPGEDAGVAHRPARRRRFGFSGRFAKKYTATNIRMNIPLASANI